MHFWQLALSKMDFTCMDLPLAKVHVYQLLGTSSFQSFQSGSNTRIFYSTTRHDIILDVSEVKHRPGKTLSHSTQYSTHTVFYQTGRSQPVCLSCNVTTDQHTLPLVVVCKAGIHHSLRLLWVSGPQSQGWQESGSLLGQRAQSEMKNNPWRFDIGGSRDDPTAKPWANVGLIWELDNKPSSVSLKGSYAFKPNMDCT